VPIAARDEGAAATSAVAGGFHFGGMVFGFQTSGVDERSGFEHGQRFDVLLPNSRRPTTVGQWKELYFGMDESLTGRAFWLRAPRAPTPDRQAIRT
jgi:hypothetical protein